MKDVYTLEDLQNNGTNIGDGDPRPMALAVIGNPIAHSLSPQMHQAVLDAEERPLRYVRLLSGLGEGDFSRLLQQLMKLRFIGANVTVPFKKQACLACEERDELARLSGSVNTLVRRGDHWLGCNTDGPGFSRAVAEFTGRPLAEQRVLILGACGGAGSALACQCALEHCPGLTLVNRPKPELPALREQLRSACGETAHCCCFSDDELPKRLEEADLIVNATSLGLRNGDPLPLNPELLHPGQSLCDIVPHDTPLRQAAAARGCRTADGLGMLLWQGALAYQRWFGNLPDTNIMRHAINAKD